MTHPRSATAVPRLLPRAGAVLAMLVGSVGLLAAPAAGQSAPTDWTQYQGGSAHPGSVVAGPVAPLAVGPLTSFDDLPGGSSESLGLSAPVVSGTTAVVVGPTSVRALTVGSGELWSVPREFGPSVPAAIGGVADGGIGCARCVPSVIYTEGWGAGPGDPTSSATPTTSVRPLASSSLSSPIASATVSVSSATSTSPSPGASAPGPVASDLMARNLSDGSKAWDAPVPLNATSRTGVTIDGARAFVGDIRGNVYAVDIATGTPQWTVDVNGFLESPIAAVDGMLLVSVNGYATNNAKLVALSAATGKVSWVYDTGHPGYVTSPAVADGRAFVGVTSFGATGSVPSLVSLDLAGDGASRSALWESKLAAPVTFATSPSIAGDQVFIEDTFGDVFAVDRTSGDQNWMFATNTKLAQGASIVIGDQVLVPTDTGSVLVLDATTGHEVFRSADAGGPLRYPAPVGIDRLIFTRGGPKPGIVTFTTDAEGTALTDIPSPTTADYGKMLGNFAMAAAGLILISLLVFKPLARRMGPAFLIDDDAPIDPTEEAR